jgi:hypothetical protein
MRCTVKSIYGALTILKVHGFPIVDLNDRVVGLIGREQLIVLLKHKCWYEFDPNSYALTKELTSDRKHLDLSAYTN